MPVVAYPNTTESFKRALYEILSENFDGDTHEYGDLQLDFPTAQIVFEAHPSIQSPISLTIAIIGDTTVNQEILKCRDNSGFRGYELRARILRTVLIVSPYQGGSDSSRANAAKNIDKAWSRFHNLTRLAPYLFVDRNIHQPEIALLSDDVIRDAGIIEASGTFSAELRVRYHAYNTL